ncbi:hypothetical protein [Entomomonas asaccharolytica]|uniref:Uncharacterized protein n=1 Tax=Entomomonas asaccharolytica TaxID=2785331 RepID=A0A974NDC3_9GAMM|nr:hypothetical protein [Entomomonas asaccharolytica]QQP84568.1 hypothetical protein JHT90_09095 [Entomomonas asaccharolytica]
MLAFLIGIILALLGTFSLFIMNVIGLLLKLDRIENTPIRYISSTILVFIHVILTIIGVWFLLDLLTTHFNIDTYEMRSWHVLAGIIVGFIPAIFILSKSVNKFRYYIEQKRHNNNE